MIRKTISRKIMEEHEPLTMYSKFVLPTGERLGVFALTKFAICVGEDVIPDKPGTHRISIDLDALIEEDIAKRKEPQVIDKSGIDRLIQLYKKRDSGHRLIDTDEMEFKSLWFAFKEYEQKKERKASGKRHIIYKDVLVCSNCKSTAIKYYSDTIVRKDRQFIDEHGMPRTAFFYENTKPFTWKCHSCGSIDRTEFKQEAVDLTGLRQNPKTLQIEHYEV